MSEHAMTERGWLVCDNPNAMLAVLRDKASDRKLRLFACACGRNLVWDLLTDEASRKAIEVAERYADGQASPEELEAAREPAESVCRSLTVGTRTYLAAFAAAVTTRTDWSAEVIAGHAAWGGSASDERPAVGMERRSRAVRDRQKAARAAVRVARAAEAHLLCDIVGPLAFRTPVPLPSSVLDWNEGLIPRMAESIYAERSLPAGHLDPARLGILADALLDAGCPAEHELLLHLRGPGPHTRGCFAVDAFLARQQVASPRVMRG